MRLPFLACMLSCHILLTVLAAADKKEEDKPIDGSSSKYKLEYQSAKSEMTKGKVFYRVRNKAHGLVTPVLWKDEKTTLMDTIIPKCSGNNPCEWVETFQTYLDLKAGKTSFSYGVNQDECTDEARAWRKSRDAEAKAKKLSPIVTGFKGHVADKGGKVHFINVTVSSSVTGKPSEYSITYRFMVGPKGSPLVFKPREDGLRIIWHSAESAMFNEERGKTKVQKITDGDKGPSVQLKHVREVSLEAGLLEIQTEDGKLAAVTAPAYRPKD